MPPQVGLGLGTALATAAPTSGLSLPIGALLSIFGGSALSGIFGSQDSPRDKAVEELLSRLNRELSYLKTPSFTKSEVENKVSEMQRTVRGGADVAATKTGTALAESLGAGGTPSGQPKGEIYTAALSPVIAAGETQAAGLEQFGMQFWDKLDSEAKARVLSGLGLISDVASVQPAMTGEQKGITSFLQMMNLLSTGFGNLAQGYTDLTHQNINLGGG